MPFDAEATMEPALRYKQTFAPLFDNLLDDREHQGVAQATRLRGSTLRHKLAIRWASWLCIFDETLLGSWLRARSPRIETIDLRATIQSVKLLEALLRCSLAEAIDRVDTRTLERMHQDRQVVLKHLESGNTLAIIMACGRFYLRFFSLSTNGPLRKSVFAALSHIKVRSPNLLDLIDRSALGLATEAMLHAATVRDLALAETAFDLLLGDGPLKRAPAGPAELNGK